MLQHSVVNCSFPISHLHSHASLTASCTGGPGGICKQNQVDLMGSVLPLPILLLGCKHSMKLQGWQCQDNSYHVLSCTGNIHDDNTMKVFGQERSAGLRIFPLVVMFPCLLCWQIKEQVGRCGPAAWALDSVNTVVCSCVVNSLVRQST